MVRMGGGDGSGGMRGEGIEIEWGNDIVNARI